MSNELFISTTIDKTPYIKKLNDDRIINVTGEFCSGKTAYISQYVNDDNYVVVDTEQIFTEYDLSEGINRELGTFFKKKYGTFPSLVDDFDLIYEEILCYFENSDKTIVIESANFKDIRDVKSLKGTLIVLRESIDTCYKRAIERYRNKFSVITDEEVALYAKKKKSIYKTYVKLNAFLEKVDNI